MSQAPESTHHPATVLPTATRKRYFISRCFAVFAFCATFFCLAMLIVFLWGLGKDVKKWFEVMPGRIEERNAELRKSQTELGKAKERLDEREAELIAEMQADIADQPTNEAKAETKAFWEAKIIPSELANEQKKVDDLLQTAAGDIREDTSAWALFLDFFTNGPAPESEPQNAGIRTAIVGTLLVVVVAMLFALPVGVGAAIFLEEYRADTWLARIIQVNINNLAGVPSIMFGILGAYLFVTGFFKPIENEMERAQQFAAMETRLQQSDIPSTGLSERDRFQALMVQELQEEIQNKEAYLQDLRDSDELPSVIAMVEADVEKTKKQQASGESIQRKLDYLLERPAWYIKIASSFCLWMGFQVAARNTLGAGLTLALLTLPVIIVASQEAIRAVPQSLRQGALALGATRWQTIWKIVLPSASPGILTGTILSMCRAIGEAAPLVMFGALLFVDQNPTFLSRFSVMPLQIFNWASRPDDAWRYNAALAGTILVVALIVMNGIAIYFRNRTQRNL